MGHIIIYFEYKKRWERMIWPFSSLNDSFHGCFFLCFPGMKVFPTFLCDSWMINFIGYLAFKGNGRYFFIDTMPLTTTHRNCKKWCFLGKIVEMHTNASICFYFWLIEVTWKGWKKFDTARKDYTQWNSTGRCTEIFFKLVGLKMLFWITTISWANFGGI